MWYKLHSEILQRRQDTHMKRHYEKVGESPVSTDTIYVSCHQLYIYIRTCIRIYTSPKDINMAPQNNKRSGRLNLHMFQQSSASLGLRPSEINDGSIWVSASCTLPWQPNGTCKMGGFINTNRPTNQTTNQPTKQPTNQPTKQTNKQIKQTNKTNNHCLFLWASRAYFQGLLLVVYF